jgi:hypothetical protein
MKNRISVVEVLIGEQEGQRWEVGAVPETTTIMNQTIPIRPKDTITMGHETITETRKTTITIENDQEEATAAQEAKTAVPWEEVEVTGAEATLHETKNETLRRGFAPRRREIQPLF